MNGRSPGTGLKTLPKPLRNIFRACLAVLCILAGSLHATEPVPTPVSADSLWDRRAEGFENGGARAEPIDREIATQKTLMAQGSDPLGSRWRLMRALYFRGEYVATDPEEKKRLFSAGRDVGEEALALLRQRALTASPASRRLERASPVELAPHLRSVPEAVPCFFWAGVDWGKWALVFGKSAAVKQGAAAKIRDYSAAVIALDPTFEDGGGYRVLGRLHHQTPSVPFFTGWASRSEALKNLRLAVERAPANFINRLYLAEAMWDYEKDNRERAAEMLRTMLSEAPSAAFVVEDSRTLEEARRTLAIWTKP